MKSRDWLVHVDKEDIYLTQREYNVLKLAADSGKTMVWFDDITISVPHISFMVRVKRQEYPKSKLLPEASPNFEANMKKLKERMI